MRLGTSTFLFLVCICSHGQSWSPGVVVLTGDSILTGQVSLLSHESILMKDDHGRVQVFPAHKVRYFRLHEESQNINRMFLALPDVSKPRQIVFFERVIRGAISVVRNCKPTSTASKDPASFNYYAQWNGAFIPIRSFHKTIYPLLKSTILANEQHAREIRQLNPHVLSEALQIIQYYNRICGLPAIAGI